MIEELKSSVEEAIKERLASPILGSYIIFFLAYNWKALVLLFWSDKKGPEKIAELLMVWPQSKHDFLYPAAASVFFIFVYPIVKLFYSTFLKMLKDVEIRYEIALVSTEVRLEELKQRREVAKVELQKKVLLERGLRSPEDLSFVLDILQKALDSGDIDKYAIDAIRHVLKSAEVNEDALAAFKGA